MTDKIYCGVGPVPKNHKLGTMQECLDKNMVKYWGLKKVDPRILEASKHTKKPRKMHKIENIRIAQVSLRGKIRKQTTDLEKEKNTARKAEINKEITELRKKLNEVNEQAKMFEKEKEAKTIPKKTSKKPSKKVAKKTSKKVVKKTSKKVVKATPVKRTSRKPSKKSNKK